MLAVTITISRAETSDVTVFLPIHGQYAFNDVFPITGEVRLVKANSFTGEWQILTTDDRLLASPRWSSDGQQIAFYSNLSSSTIINITTGTVSEVNFAGHNYLMHPEGWSVDDSTVLYRGFSFPSPTEYAIDVFDVNTGSLTNLLSYTFGQALNHVPFHPSVGSATFNQIREAHLNPVHSDFMVLQIDISPTVLLDPNGELFPFANVVYNRSTGQMLSLDQLIANEPISGWKIRWSPDGRRLYLSTSGHRTLRNWIVALVNNGGNWSLDVEKSAEGPPIVDWIGVDDLFLAQGGSGFHIAQIINGEWHSTPVFELSHTTFANMEWGDFYLNAGTEERYQLSCLFDQAQPTRLSIDTRARVNFTDGTPLRLRAEPSVEAAEIQQMPEGTEFEVIGGPACENGESYYRFWQVELDDDTVGWAAEADMESYLIEPV